jgi:hypothetical protein
VHNKGFSLCDSAVRLAAVREAILHSWGGYKKFAWGQDELQPDTQNSHKVGGLVAMVEVLGFLGQTLGSRRSPGSDCVSVSAVVRPGADLGGLAGPAVDHGGEGVVQGGTEVSVCHCWHARFRCCGPLGHVTFGSLCRD